MYATGPSEMWMKSAVKTSPGNEIRGVVATLPPDFLDDQRCCSGKLVPIRGKPLIPGGIAEHPACQFATNGRGPWWNSGASPTGEPFPKTFC